MCGEIWTQFIFSFVDRYFSQYLCLRRLSHLQQTSVVFWWHWQGPIYWAGSGSAAIVHWTVCLPLPWCCWLALQCHLELHWIISDMYHFLQASLYLGYLCINMISRFLFMVFEVSCRKVKCLDVWTDHITTYRNTVNFKIMSHSICINHLFMF